MTPRARLHVGALDQGTTSTRFVLFDARAEVVAFAAREHRQIIPRPGWLEHDAAEIVADARAVIGGALDRAGLAPADLAAVGITNQRETAVLWDRRTGAPLHNALNWQDARTAPMVAALAVEGGPDRLRARTGLPLSPYFSATKLRWLLDEVPGARAMAEAGDALFGTVDAWLLWNLTGGPAGGVHATDVTNASRTQLMDLATLDWDAGLLALFAVPRACLPAIRSSSEVYGTALAPLEGVPIAGILGDQQAALFGQGCLKPGNAKTTYGTGNFLLMNTGPAPRPSAHGLLTTVAYKLGDAAPVYALEGSVAVTGGLVRWLRDNLGIIGASDEVEALARTAPDNGGVYVVPAFAGLFAPRWNAGARGIICGLTAHAHKGHVARAALEAAAYATREVLEAMAADSGVVPGELRADGGMTVNDLLMQFQADVAGLPVVRARVVETTALGAAFAAGLAVGFWDSPEAVAALVGEGRRWEPRMGAEERERLFQGWRRAVERSLDWEA